MKEIKCKLVRGKESINRNLNVAYLYAELEVPMLKISVECKRNTFAHQYTSNMQVDIKREKLTSELRNIIENRNIIYLTID